jgi:glycine/D-amino acid oxidase-like deaminating enzyme
MTGALPVRSPWLEQLRRGDPPSPLTADLHTDVVVVGGGIAGASTAFFILRETDLRVALVERGTIGSGATGHNAGQLATYFERPLADMVAEYGFDATIEAQGLIDSAWGLIELMVRECGTDQRLERFTGNMGMFNLDHVLVHLRQLVLRRDGGLAMPMCLVSRDAPFLASIPDEFDGLYRVVDDAELRAVLGPGTERYCAALCSPIGAANGALLVQRVVDHLRRTHPHRFVFADHTKVEEITLGDDGAVVRTEHHSVACTHVVMCTNGYTDHSITLADGTAIPLHRHITGDRGYMVGLLEPEVSPPRAYSFIRNERIGDDEQPYIYVTRRTWDMDGATQTLVVVGGPERVLDDVAPGDDDRDEWFPRGRIEEFDHDVMPLAHPSHTPGTPYDFQWHGLMGYTDSKLRFIGRDPRHPALFHNLGCNGVGFMPSVVGGHRVARLLAGDTFPPSLFDPPAG